MPVQASQVRASSSLRQTHYPPSSPDERAHLLDGAGDSIPSETNGIPEQEQDENTHSIQKIDESTGLLQNQNGANSPHYSDSLNQHDTISPTVPYERGYGSFMTDMGTQESRDEQESVISGIGATSRPRFPSWQSNFSGTGFVNAISTNLLGKNKAVRANGTASEGDDPKRSKFTNFIVYYIPILRWIRQYKLSYLQGDLIAAITMASFYIPISLSYASNLAHIPPINGLYSFVFNPLVYAILGTCPQMVVGPEAAGSLLTGGVVKEAIVGRKHHDTDDKKNAQVAGMVTGLAGAIILGAGLCRLGFLDSVLSRPFLRGFISAIGVVIFFDQLIPEMGLDGPATHSTAAHGSSLQKIMFLFRHGHEAHRLTCIVSFSTIAIVLFLRFGKQRLQPRYKWAAYIPDRFAVVVLSAILSWKLKWEQKGVDILGDIKAKGQPFKPEFPFKEHNFKHVDDAFATGFVIALLGFFESSVAAKSLQAGSQGLVRKIDVRDDGSEEEIIVEPDGLKGMAVSTNRELVALGAANILGGIFMSIPAFGGYGRSKVNLNTGGKTPMSSVFLSLITIICILFLLPYFYYIPKGTLSAMITVVAISLVEEAPHDIRFFYKVSGWNELILMFLIFLTTFLWNLRIGIAVGIGLSLLRLLRHSTRPRIQILGRLPGTTEFDNAEAMPDTVEMVPNCLIVKIPEPLTFANTGSLKDRLNRLEGVGLRAAHLAIPRARRAAHYQSVIFDIHGVTGMDPAAAQVLLGIIEDYVNRGRRVLFCRTPSTKSEVWRLMQVSGIVDLCGGPSSFFRSVSAALHAMDEAAQATKPQNLNEAEMGTTSAAGVGAGSSTLSAEDPSQSQARVDMEGNKEVLTARRK